MNSQYLILIDEFCCNIGPLFLIIKGILLNKSIYIWMIEDKILKKNFFLAKSTLKFRVNTLNQKDAP